MRVCSNCGGAGVVERPGTLTVDRCSRCRGRGREREEETALEPEELAALWVDEGGEG